MANTGAPPNYYKILEISEAATTQQVRDAYKKAALKTHPDRVPADSPERATRTRKFQLVNDAYYTLSDTQRRREYDAQRKIFGASAGTTYGDFSDDDDSDPEEVPPQAGPNPQNAYSWAWNFFTGGKQGQQNEGQRAQADNAQFGDVFEEMLREEGMAEEGTNRPTSSFWSMVGGLSGGALGFIVGNMPGALAGAVAGNRLGSVRDAKGKSVYAVFQDLPQADRARLLTQLAAKVFSHTVGA
ncbi:DnaJ domain-containing protein [Colletotrichum costaricense]|uniref:DnaJ domain-containing protein n=1 Tax=Colletotrichum costaricense TaxID=1209916 RepID=A0AAJ0DWN9_9PEZI|nr:DnaJ domain-containing protein [Colletotrichum costaricense]KAI3537090.1 DnaJ domain-containing protein [Colletotrichum filicis]KAK1517868.1 DnaJ domain-containing protein [Colletotrichum costaricense]KAK1704436.1 DnaJ domain-containing protein [Colletotrichum lupini]